MVAPAEAEVVVVVRGDEVGSRIGVGEVVAAVGVVVVVVADVASASRLHALKRRVEETALTQQQCCSSLNTTHQHTNPQPTNKGTKKEYKRKSKKDENSHIRACQSPLPVASTFPAGLRSIEMTLFLWPCSMHCTIAVCASQNCTPRSFEPDTTHAPSWDTATEST